ncbi:MAG: DNA recombination/repair protein RecA [Brevundimonas diminuta]|nr:DNA recombination/repair protein RecA [Brevundimonas diminuta]MBD3818554.1 DNA recombination/repair protein RecA [Brevundimonas diminuta]
MSQAALKLVGKEDGDKQRALEAAIAQIDRAFGKGSVMKLGKAGQVAEIESVSTGSLGLDMALGIGGLPVGRVIEVFGPESSGKTTLALHTVAEVQKKGGVAAFVDAEHALDPVYAQKLGVNLDDLLVSQPDAGEQALEIVEGGNALKFYASVRLDIRRTGAIKNRDEVVGNTTRVKVVKNKVAPPFREVIFDIMYGEGISKIGEIIDLGVKANIIEKSGSWFSYDSTRIGQGRENAKEFLKNNPDMALAIEKAVRQSTAKIADDMLGAPEPDEGQDLEG